MASETEDLGAKVRESVRQYGASVVDCPEPFTKIPEHSTPTGKPGQLSTEELRKFYEDGYVILREYLTDADIQPCLDAVSEMVDRLAHKLYDAGKITDLFEDAGVYSRLTKLEEAHPGANILLFKEGKLPKAFMDLWSSNKLVNLAEQILGPDVAGHPVWNLRVKTPNNDATVVPWHQDAAYFSADSYDHMILSAWIPFLDTNEKNGGMRMMRGSHKLGRVAKHTCCHQSFWYVMLDEEDMEKTLGSDCAHDLVTCDVPYGGVLLFNQLTAHGTGINTSDKVRWSVDLRWQSPHEKWGFYNIAQGVVFRDPKRPNLEPDWQSFLKVNRKEVWQRMHFDKVLESDPFDTTVTGPWIGRWEIVNVNKHTQAFVDNKA